MCDVTKRKGNVANNNFDFVFLNFAFKNKTNHELIKHSTITSPPTRSTSLPEIPKKKLLFFYTLSALTRCYLAYYNKLEILSK